MLRVCAAQREVFIPEEFHIVQFCSPRMLCICVHGNETHTRTSFHVPLDLTPEAGDLTPMLNLSPGTRKRSAPQLTPPASARAPVVKF